ncbi:WYL domain-containing protein [Paenibacillus sp.]|uniref:helix-turn-helix transcriptional regulator n=1 Tax=Paenibacillus sp. TaxID=58172 RepID=UPI00283AADE3|nr:WYL domain-containing protein [Paenibacillus sp.]
MDFGVLREAEDINGMLRLLEKAISDQMKVSFYYTNAQNAETVRTVEPIALTYKWHAWYVFAFCETREEYRYFKLIRMRHLNEARLPFLRDHEHSDILLEKYGAVQKIY